MIGQEYFDLRSRLDAALLALRGIATECGSGDEQAAAISDLINGLKEPFLLVVASEADADKTAFLNALSGEDFSKAGEMSASETLLLIKHGPELRREAVTEALTEVHAPLDFLRNFNVANAPGGIPAADVVIFLFSALNPWGAPAWQFLEKIHPQLSDKVMLVLQHADQREPEEIQSILPYMKRLCVQRFGREFPIFPVSANRAYLARSSGLDADRLLAESGFNKLEEHISGIICGSRPHLEKLAGALGTVRRILGKLQGGIEKLAEARVKRAAVLRTIDSGLTAQAQRTFDKISAVSEAAATSLQQSVQGLTATAAAQLESRVVLRNLLRKEQPLAGLEQPAQAEPAGADQACWNRAASIFEEDMTAMADQVRKQMADGLKARVDGELKPDAVFWAAQRGRFLAQATGIQQRAISGLTISQHLAPVLAPARKLALRQLILTTACIVAAIVFIVCKWWMAAGCAAAAAVLVYLFTGREQAKMRARVMSECESSLSAAPVKMKNLLDQQLRDETESLYELFNKALKPVREELDELERKQVKLHRQVENLGRVIEGLEAELGAGSGLPS